MPDINKTISSKFLRFKVVDPIGQKKYPTIYVDNKYGERLGKIQYDSQWKKFVWEPKQYTKYDKGCHDDIGKAIDYAEGLRTHGS